MEMAVVAVGTAIAVISMGLFLKWVATRYGTPAMVAAIAAEILILFPLAFWLDRKK